MSAIVTQLRLAVSQLLCYTSSNYNSCNQIRNKRQNKMVTMSQTDANENKANYDHLLKSHTERQHKEHEDRLLKVDEIPLAMREPYIYTGYRPVDRSWGYYAKSLIQIHNETCNVWTHVIGFLLVAWRFYHYLTDDRKSSDTWWIVLIFSITAVGMLTLSAIAHLFHSKSRWCNYAFYLMDYMGVTICAFGTGISSMFIFSSPIFFETFNAWFLVVNILLGWFAFFACCVSKVKLTHNNSQRKAMMISGVLLQAVVSAIPPLIRIMDILFQGGPILAINEAGHVIGVFALLVLSAATFAAHMPEVIWPGKFDIWGHSHQWFHIIVVLGVLQQVQAIDIEVNLVGIPGHRHRQPHPSQLVLSLVVLVALQSLTLIYYLRQVVDSDLKPAHHCCKKHTKIKTN